MVIKASQLPLVLFSTVSTLSLVGVSRAVAITETRSWGRAITIAWAVPIWAALRFVGDIFNLPKDKSSILIGGGKTHQSRVHHAPPGALYAPSELVFEGEKAVHSQPYLITSVKCQGAKTESLRILDLLLNQNPNLSYSIF